MSNAAAYIAAYCGKTDQHHGRRRNTTQRTASSVMDELQIFGSPGPKAEGR